MPKAGRTVKLRGSSAFGALLLFVASSIAGLTGRAGAQDAARGPLVDANTLDEVADYISAQRDATGIPGLAAAVVHGDEAVLLQGFGRTETDGDAVDPDAPFFIASLSKSLTAIAVMQLVEQGSLRLDEPVSTYLPELGNNADEVSIRRLLHHRSGLSTYNGRDPIAGGDGESLESNVARLGPHLERDAAYRYSNANYDALALIVQRVSGVSFSDYMRRNVFEPLQMDRSFVDRDEAVKEGLVQGHYHWLFGGYRPHDARMPKGMAGSATMFSSAGDLANVLSLHLNRGSFRGEQILSEASMRETHKPAEYAQESPERYAMGWYVLPAFGPRATTDPGLTDLTMLYHDGLWSTYRSIMWMVPEAELGFVLLANGSDLADDTTLPQIGRGVRALLFGLEPPAIEAGSELLERWGKHLLLAVVVIQIALAAWTVLVLRRAKRERRFGRAAWTNLALATALDFVAVVLLVWIVPAAGESPLAVPLGYPDYRILFAGMIAGVAWGLVRTGLAATLLVRRGDGTHSPKSGVRPRRR